MVEERDTERTTVVHTEGRRGGGGIAAAVVILLLLFLLFMFRNEIFGAADDVQKVDVEVATEGS
ncbi:MAG TPA: hypothetical protein VNT25_07195 [Allosphingosinicella sp.]|nr:hypothetical protein [Allosphingosinicella sp.]